MTPIEKVARAIYEAQPRNKPWVLLTPLHRSRLETEARAAIEALREPSEAMRAVTINDVGRYEDDWEAMIDAALAERPK